MQPRLHLDVGKNVLPPPHERMVHLHAGIVDRRMDDAIGIGLRRPDVVVDSPCEGLAGGIELKDGDDFPRLRFFDQVVVLEAPGGGHVRAEAAACMTSVTTRPGANVQDANLQDVAGHSAFYRQGAG
jgi:hypothetical protein